MMIALGTVPLPLEAIGVRGTQRGRLSDFGPPDAGFSLIEGMVAAAVLAIGLLSLAGLQAISFGRTMDAHELTAATSLAADMLERIQFNRRSVAVYHGIDTTLPATQPLVDAMAQGDYTQWQGRLVASGLPNARGTVAVTPIGPTTPALNQNQVTVRIVWRGAMKSETSTFVDRTMTLVTVVAPE